MAEGYINKYSTINYIESVATNTSNISIDISSIADTSDTRPRMFIVEAGYYNNSEMAAQIGYYRYNGDSPRNGAGIIAGGGSASLTGSTLTVTMLGPYSYSRIRVFNV